MKNQIKFKNFIKGDWVKGEKSGIGKYYFNDKSIYEGQWKNDDKFGEGVMTYSNDDTYTGYWLDGERSGHGNFYLIKKLRKLFIKF